MKKIFLGILAVLWPLVSQAQNQKVDGHLVDKSTGDVVAGATIFFQQHYLISDRAGKFILDVDRSKSAKIVISHLGYETYEASIDDFDNGGITIELTSSVQLLEEVLVSADSRPQTSQRRISRETLERTNPKNIGDIFSDETGFGIIKRGGYAMDPVFRSFKYEQLNLIYDGGIYISNACPNRMDPASTQLSPAEIDRIELIKGPFSMRYGPTFGGLINIITTKPAATEQLDISGELDGGYEVNGNGITARGTVNLAQEKYDISLQGGLLQFDNYKNGNGEIVPSSFSSSNYAARLGFNPTHNQRLQVTWRQSFGRDIQHASLPMDSPKDNSSIISVDYGLRPQEPVFSEFNVKAFHTYVDHLMTNENRPNFKMVDARSPVTSTTSGGRLEFGLNISQGSHVYVGADARSVGKDGVRNRKVKIMNGNVIDPPKEFKDLIWQDSWLFDLGLFSEATVTFNESWGMVLGTRADYVKSGANDVSPDFTELYGTIDPDPELNLSLTTSLNHYFGQNGLVQLALGRGQRAADLSERYINHFNIGMDAYEYVGDPNLRSEINNQGDLTIRNTVDRFHWNVNVFYSYLQHYITAIVDESLPRKYMPGAEPAYAKRFININQAWQVGFDASLRYSISKSFTATAGAYYTYAQNVDFDEPLAEIPPFTGLLGLKYAKQNLWGELKGRLVARQDRVADTFDESETPGFNVFDVTAGYTLFRSLQVSLTLKNLFNTYYYEHLSRSYKNQSETGMFSEPGRSFRIGLKYRF